MSDIHVFSRDAVPEMEPPVSPWMTQTADGHIEGFPTERAACWYQRQWREAHGLDPMADCNRYTWRETREIAPKSEDVWQISRT